jgi:hypothetical protein
MEYLENYIVKYIHITGRANVFTDNHINFYLKSTTFFKDKLKNEILENRILLGDNFKKYLEFVSHRIKTETNFIIEEEVLENWRVSFNLQEIDFNAKSIVDLKTSLHNLGIKLNLLDDEIISSKDRQILYDIFDFHISSIEIIDFIDEFLFNKKTIRVKENLPSFKDVFFVHYQCEDFNVSDEITSLSIFADDKVIEFKNKSEEENIEEYCNTVNELLERGLIPIHWSQNRPYFGVEHIMSRYHKLTGKKIELEYQDSLNLSAVLKHKFGEEYVNHPRLDNLAHLNSFNGSSIKEKGLRTFDANRVLLLSKIYFGILNKTLKIGIYNAAETTVVLEQVTNNIEVIEQSSLNDYTRSTIEDYLEDIVDDINPGDYSVLVDALYCYFTTSKFPKLERKIIFKRVNKKKVGWALKEVYKNLKTDNLDVEYFRFAQENINLFENEVIVTEGFLQSKFYKAFTTNPAR